MAIARSQPIDEPAAPVAAVPIATVGKTLESEDESAVDMEPSESALKIIEHKLEHWTKKCIKHGGCQGTIHREGWSKKQINLFQFQFSGYGGYGLGGLSGYGLGGYNTLGYGGFGSPYGLGQGYGIGYPFGFGYPLGYGLGGYGLGLGGYGYGKKR